MDNVPDSRLLNVHGESGVGGNLVRVVHAGEPLDLSSAGLGVDSPFVGLLCVLERRGNVHEIEAAVLGDGLARLLAAVVKGSDRGCDDRSAGLGELGRDEGGPLDVLVSILARKAKVGRDP